MSWTPSDFVGLGLGKAYKKKALQNPMVKDEYDEKQLTISTRNVSLLKNDIHEISVLGRRAVL